MEAYSALDQWTDLEMHGPDSNGKPIDVVGAAAAVTWVDLP
jgi:hypothetical protein